MDHAIAESHKRLDHLEAHLRRDNPTLLEAVRSFRTLDHIVQRMGLLPVDESFATQVPWYPLVSFLGTFSAGKSSFINSLLGMPVQRTGNQAVDDKFTVLCSSADDSPRTLPGAALDADPRFPFFRISEQIEKVAPGEGQRADLFLQLKTAPADMLRGRILIDSPGFDADAQRSAILRLTDHIIHLSDLVLVFFDARHPEPGAMRDTLEHLVRQTRLRNDQDKFLFVLNQMDTTAREDNPEEVFAAWQKGLAENGLTTGRFYQIYNPDCAVPIEDPEQRRRYEARRDHDLQEIHDRIHQVEVTRAYRIVDAVESTCRRLLDDVVPTLRSALEVWRKKTLLFSGLGALLFTGIILGLLFRDGVDSGTERWNNLPAFGLTGLGANLTRLGIFAILLWLVHGRCRSLARAVAARRLAGGLAETPEGSTKLDLMEAFKRSTGFWRQSFRPSPKGFGKFQERQIRDLLAGTTTTIQSLNDRFARPSGASSDGDQNAS